MIACNSDKDSCVTSFRNHVMIMIMNIENIEIIFVFYSYYEI